VLPIASAGYHNCLGRYADSYGAAWRLRNRVAIKREVRIFDRLLVDSASAPGKPQQGDDVTVEAEGERLTELDFMTVSAMKAKTEPCS
jgi:hypothetical protein